MSGSFDVLLFGEALVDELPGGRVPGGAPFNVACHLRELGASPLLVTRIGRDEDGGRLVAAMRRRGLDVRGVQRDGRRPTARVVVRPGADGPRFLIPDDQAFDAIDAATARAAVGSGAPRVVYFGTLAQRREVSRETLAGLLDKVSGRRFLDLNLRAPWFDREVVDASLRKAAVAKMNEGEAAEVARLLGLPEHGVPFRQAIAARYGLGGIVVTRGADGAVYRDADGTEALVGPAARTRRIVDTVGAGDAFSAVQILGILRGWSAEETLRGADDFARAVCRLRGAVPRRLSFYEPFRKRWSGGGDE